MKTKIVYVLALVATVVSFVSCATTQLISLDEETGLKGIYSTSKLKEKDFSSSSEGSDFFIEDIDYRCSSSYIFSMIKSKIQEGEVTSVSLSDEEDSILKSIAEKGQFITYSPRDMIIAYSVYDKNTQRYVEYDFGLVIDNTAYAAYKKTDSYIATCNIKINDCNETIKKCSNPTIEKSRIVQVPYTVTERVFVPGNIGARTSHYGSSEITYDHYETRTYTEYRDEIEFYTIPDPNYNPKAVEKAKKDLQYWQSEKSKANDRKEKLPFDLFPL